MATAKAKYILTADDQTGQAFDSVKRRFGDSARVAAKAGAAIGAAAGVGFAKMASDAINAADEIGKLAREIGVTTENLSEMKGVLEITGGDFEAYTKAIRRMQRAIVDLSDGSGEIEDAFAAIGLAIQDVQDLNPEEQFRIISSALEGVADATERSARAQEIFGRGSRTVLRLVSAGADEVARLRQEQAAFGNTLSTETTDAAEAFNDAIARMGQSLRGATTTTVAENMTSIADSMESMVELIPAVIKGVGAVASFIKGVGTVLGGGAAAIGALASGNFSEAGTIARDVASDVFGSDEGTEKVVGEQQTTNDILRGIARDGVTARAG